MIISEFKSTLSAEEIEAVKAVAEKSTSITEEDKNTYYNYITKSAQALGEDQIAEPLRYIVASTGGLRAQDLEHLIGEDFSASVFEEWNNLLGTPVLTYRNLPANTQLYDVAPQMRELLRNDMGENNFKSCASDIGYYLMEHCPVGDVVRDTQTMHLLLDGMEAAAAAEYISQAEGAQLRMAVGILGNGLKDAPDYVKDTIWDMTRAEGEKVNQVKLMLLMLNDCVAIVANPDNQKPIIEKLNAIVGQYIALGKSEMDIVMGIAKLRLAQNARIRKDEQEAQQTFIGAMNYLLPMLQQTDAKTFTRIMLDQYWLCLKICQEMAQPKAMAKFFELIVKIEQEQSQDESRSVEERAQIAENIIGQHIDMSKVYFSMPKQMQEQFVNYSEATVALLKAFVGKEAETHNDDVLEPQDIVRLAGYYQALGELTLHLQRFDESYDALTEAQILQMRYLAMLQKEDGQDAMSPNQLITRLALSTTNHMIAAHYRRNNKSHDLGVTLRSNMNLAEDCFRFYANDGRVIHFFINAALELGDYQHSSRGYLAECGTYEKVIREFPKLNNIRLDGNLAADVAMIHTKCGQTQADNAIRRYKDAVLNLETALRLWKALAENTKNPQFKQNAEAVQQMLSQLKK